MKTTLASCHTEVPYLRAALTPEEVTRRMNDLGVSGRVTRCELMRYKAQKRCLIHYQMTTGDIIGKIRFKGADTKTNDLQHALFKQGFGRGAADYIQVAEPLGVIAEWHMTLQRLEPGVVATCIFREGDVQAQLRLAMLAARAISKLHHASVRPTRHHTIADELQILNRQLARVAAAKPGWAQRVRRLLGACQGLSRQLPKTAAVTIHRDFYADQVLIDGARCTLIDLDTLSLGDPALDVGNFAAHLKEQALRERGHLDHLYHAEKALIETYLALNPSVPKNAIDIYIVLSLVRHVAISQRIASRRRLTGPLLTACDEIVAQLL